MGSGKNDTSDALKVEFNSLTATQQREAMKVLTRGKLFAKKNNKVSCVVFVFGPDESMMWTEGNHMPKVSG